MTAVGWLPVSVEDLFGPEATAEESYEVLTVDVPSTGWIAALRVARDDLGCTYFDWLSAVDEPGTGLRVLAHVIALSPVRRLLVRTTVPYEAPGLPSAVGIYAGAAWHERETHEMFGVSFEGHPEPDHLLLPDGFEGHPLRKDFVLAARVAKAWPGAKEPGESDHGGPKRRQMLPPGVPDPNEWGPLRGQLPPAPARPARTAGRTADDRPARRTRTAAEGSQSQAPAGGTAKTPAPQPRARSVSEGSASQRGAEAGAGATAPTGPRRARSASEGSASQRANVSAAEGTAARLSTAPRSSDAPWHHARPAFDKPEPTPEPPTEPVPTPEPPTEPEPEGNASAEAHSSSAETESATADGEAQSSGAKPPESPSPDETPTPDDPSGGTQ